MYAPVPPVGLAKAVPSQAPLQVILVPVTVTLRSGGLVNITVSESKQPEESVTVITYVPAHSPESTCPTTAGNPALVHV